MPPAREPFPSELAIVRQEAPRAVASWVASAGLGGRISATDQRDLTQDLLTEFTVYWRTRFEFGACTPGGEIGPDDIEAGLRLAVRGLAGRYLPLALNRRSYGGAVRVTRYGVAQGEHGGAVEYDGARDDRRAEEDQESGAALAELRERIVVRLLELADGGRPAWFRGLEMAAGVSAEQIMARDGIGRRTAHYGRDLLVRLFGSDAQLAALVEEADGDLGESMHGICAEVLARSAGLSAPAAAPVPAPAPVEEQPVVEAAVEVQAQPRTFLVPAPAAVWLTLSTFPAGPRPAGCTFPAGPRPAGCRSTHGLLRRPGLGVVRQHRHHRGAERTLTRGPLPQLRLLVGDEHRLDPRGQRPCLAGVAGLQALGALRDRARSPRGGIRVLTESWAPARAAPS